MYIYPKQNTPKFIAVKLSLLPENQTVRLITKQHNTPQLRKNMKQCINTKPFQ